MDLLSSTQWNKFKSAIRDVTDTFMKEPVQYVKQVTSLDRFDEDRADRYTTPITLHTLIEWKSTKNTEDSKGTINREYAKLTFDMRVLAEAGLVINGVCTIEADKSIFNLLGSSYKVMACYPDAQAEDEHLLYIVEVQIDAVQQDIW